MLAYAASLNIKTCVVLTKADLVSQDEADGNLQIQMRAYRDAGFELLESSSDDLGKSVRTYAEAHLREQVWALAGPSGVGKSSLVNAILEEAYMDIGSVSERLGRGKHTTRHVELIPYKNGFMVDTPGFSALDVADLELSRANLDAAYPDFTELGKQCRFADCRHAQEPGCALKSYISEAPEQAGRFNRYAILLEQIETVASLRKEGKK